MGNCIRHESSMTWAGEDWRCLTNEMNNSDNDHQNDIKISKKKKKNKIEEGKKLFEELRSSGFAKKYCSSNSTKVAGPTEVKIKITKKQLEEFLGKGDQLKQMSIQQVLSQLISVSDRYEAQQRSWRPVLQSIAEVN